MLFTSPNSHPYTDYTVYPTFHTVYSWTSTLTTIPENWLKLDITNLSYPFCFASDPWLEDYLLENSLSNLLIQEYVWWEQAGNQYLSYWWLIYCLTKPSIAGTHEIFINQDLVNKLYILPTSLTNTMFDVPQPVNTCDLDSNVCIDQTVYEWLLSWYQQNYLFTWTTERSLYNLVNSLSSTWSNQYTSISDVTLTETEKTDIFNTFQSILYGMLMIVFFVFLWIFVKKLLSSFWN